MFDIHNFEHYSRAALKIQTKSNGLQPFKLRKIQLKFIEHLKNDFPDGIVRSISLKCRQTGWSTLIAGINTHKICTSYSHKGILIADKFARSQAIHSIYATMIDNLPGPITPMIAKRNESEILFDNPDPSKRDRFPGLSSGFVTETAQDKDSGKSSSRQFAHLSEYAFFPFAMELDQSVQNSIPLAKGTAIWKESTASGMAGTGESFYEQWMAAERGDYIYRPFFVPWFDVEDYALEVPRGFILTKEEIDIIKRCPEITNANLVWRRMKMKEIHTSSESGLTPEELFKQDFPSYPEEAFLSTGRPVFDMNKLKEDINDLRKEPPQLATIKITQPFLSMYPGLLKIFATPIKGKKYMIGADVSEGLEIGDASSAKILDEDLNEVGLFHGKLDPDHFGEVLVELARIYNNALLIPEINSMGSTTLQAIKRAGYLRVWMRSVQDEIQESKETAKMGWRTTAANKQQLLNGLITAYRDGDLKIRDIEVLREMSKVVRGENGHVDLNGKDRVVALCLGIVGIGQSYEKAVIYNPNKQEKLIFETRDESRSKIIKTEKERR